MVGHVAELSLVVGHEFREGNGEPAAEKFESLRACEDNMPEGKKIAPMQQPNYSTNSARRLVVNLNQQLNLISVSISRVPPNG